ncbi:MAG: hypothetical protein WC451_05295 [Patescibacteria group bacterium]
MTFKFHNDFHGTTATATARDWRLTQRQVRRIWRTLCGETDCDCGYGGVEGPNKYRLKKLGGILFYEGAEVIPQ